ncbi:MAG: hypothetical protein S0880_33690 [Actinomycetota bacterium]|nr:hypothetical protein [Actinomycetota bacterium]
MDAATVSAIAGLVGAVCDEGGNVDTHREIWRAHRSSHTDLWEALDRMLPGADAGEPTCTAGLSLDPATISVVAAASAPSASGWAALEAAVQTLTDAVANPDNSVQVTTAVARALTMLTLAVCDEGGRTGPHVEFWLEHRSTNGAFWEQMDQLLPDADPARPDCSTRMHPDAEVIATLADESWALSPAWPALESALAQLSSAHDS